MCVGFNMKQIDDKILQVEMISMLIVTSLYSLSTSLQPNKDIYPHTHILHVYKRGINYIKNI